MTEGMLRQFLTQKLALEGYICWFAPRVKFRKQQDIFGVWDGIAAKGIEVRFIQFTTKSNQSSHVKKIQDFKKLYGISHKGELWLYDHKTRDFEIVYL